MTVQQLQNHIDGAWVPSKSTDWLEVVNPATEEVLALLPAGSAEDVDDAVASASRAAVDWAARTLDDRLQVLGRAADTVDATVEELARIEATEMGRPAAVGVPWIAAAAASFRGSLATAREYPFERQNDPSTVVERRPLGVVALVTPWNFPSNVILDALGPLLASGNTVVLKPSEKSPLSAMHLMDVLALPPGVVNLVHGDGRAGAPLVAHPGLGLTHFTGSVRTGKQIAAASAANLRRAVLELGGKDPVVIDADVDIDVVARDVARGAFVNSGQICTSMERIYVHRDIAREFTDALVENAKQYTYGDPRDDVPMGPMVDEFQLGVVTAHVNDAIARGATAETGGQPAEGLGYFYPATVLTGVTDDMVIMREETFGPVAPIQVVESFAEGLERAKRSPYGLGATVYTNDPDHVLAARDIPAGLVWVNKWQGGGTGVTYEPARQSGLTPTGHLASFDAATRPFSVMHNQAM